MNRFIASFVISLCGLACTNWEPQVCENGLRCPPGATCAAAQYICITDKCGNGIIDPLEGEVCDDGNVIAGDGCSSDCRSTEVCGNQITDFVKGEECDDGGESSSCDWNCTIAMCGDETVNQTAGEECDEGGETIQCDVDCTIAICGDATINRTAGEDCDDNGVNTRRCDADCTVAMCGDGNVNPASDEVCDDAGESLNCDSDCTIAMCGDQTINRAASEECDDGGETEQCDSDCTLAECGDGTLNRTRGEVCDTSGINTLYCDWDCTRPECGDNIPNFEAGEKCDDGGENTRNCNYNCTLPECGDRIYNPNANGEECDHGGDTFWCDGDCTKPECPDGYVNPAAFEECDDGNERDDDSCIDCKNARCGDGHLWTNVEQCDDGDTTNGGNGCDEQCRFTSGMTCDPADLNKLGTPARRTGVRIEYKSYVFFGDDTQTYRVKKSCDVGECDYAAFPLVYMNDPQSEDDQRWSFSVVDEGSAFAFTINTTGGSASNRIKFVLYVLGFDKVRSKVTCQKSLSGGASTNWLYPSTVESKAKIISFPYMDGYLTGADDDVGWNIYRQPSGCEQQRYGSSLYNAGSGDISWGACMLSLAEAIRIEEWNFDVGSGSFINKTFNINPNAEHVWMPIVSVYDTAGDDDFGYEVSCLTGSTTLRCTAQAFDGNAYSKIKGSVLLLESAYGF